MGKTALRIYCVPVRVSAFGKLQCRTGLKQHDRFGPTSTKSEHPSQACSSWSRNPKDAHRPSLPDARGRDGGIADATVPIWRIAIRDDIEKAGTREGITC
jgi:hypothetical protein